MSKNILIIAAIVVVVIVLGVTTAYIALRQGDMGGRQQGGIPLASEEPTVQSGESSAAQFQKYLYTLSVSERRERETNFSFSAKPEISLESIAQQIEKQFSSAVRIYILESLPPWLRVDTIDLETCEKVREFLRSFVPDSLHAIPKCERLTNP